MKEFFDKLSNFMDFQTQIYIIMGVFFLLLLLCFILLVVVGVKNKKLAEEVKGMRKALAKVKKTANAVQEAAGEQPVAGEISVDAEQEAPEEKVIPEKIEEDETEDLPEAGQSPEKEADDRPAEDAPEKNADKNEAATEATATVLPEEQQAFNEAVEAEIDALKEKTDLIAKNQRKSFDKIKVVRYSSTLPDGTETVSYSIGITNQDRDGIVLTGTETADGATSLVVKSVKGGLSKTPLTAAEDCAIKRG